MFPGQNAPPPGQNVPILGQSAPCPGFVTSLCLVFSQLKYAFLCGHDQKDYTLTVTPMFVGDRPHII